MKLPFVNRKEFKSRIEKLEYYIGDAAVTSDLELIRIQKQINLLIEYLNIEKTTTPEKTYFRRVVKKTTNKEK